MQAPADRLMCAKEVAKRLGMSTKTLWRRVNLRDAPQPVIRSPGRRALWRESDVNAYIAALRPVV